MKNTPSLGLLTACGLLASVVAQTPRHDKDRIYLYSTATTSNLWVFDSCCDAQRPSDPRLNGIHNLQSSTKGHKPSQIHVDREGFLWIVDATNNTVSKFIAPPSGAASLRVFEVSLAPTYSQPGDFHFDQNGDGNLLVTKAGARKLITIDKDNRAPIREFVYLASGHGDPTFFSKHSNGNVYFFRSNGWLTHVRKFGTQWVEQGLWYTGGARGHGLTEGPAGNLWVTYGSWLGIRGPSGKKVAEVQSGNRWNITGHPVAFPTPSGAIECWAYVSDGRGAYEVSRYEYKANALKRVATWFRGTFKYIALDGRCRVWFMNWGLGGKSGGAGGVYWSISRTGGSLSRLQYRTSPTPIWGDPTGFARAVSVDKAYDDDGDGFTNIVEVGAGSNPFDPRSVPNQKIPCRLHVPSPLPINSEVTFTLSGVPGSQYFLITGAKQSPFALPGFLGKLELAPPYVALFSSFSTPFTNSLPASGTLQWRTGIPNIKALQGKAFYFQGLTFPLANATGFSNLATLTIRR